MPRDTRWGCAGLVFIALAVWLIGITIDVGAEVPTSGMAEVMCEDFVTNRLRPPGAPAFQRHNVAKAGANTWTVSGSVDAQDDVGALVRFNYECTVHGDTSGQWTLLQLDHERR